VIRQKIEFGGTDTRIYIAEEGEGRILFNLLNEKEKNMVFSKKTPRNQLQEALKIYALKELKLADKIEYTDSGKPYLTTGGHISISHSGRAVAITTAPFPVGVDIQEHDNRMFSLAAKFLNREDYLPTPDTGEALHCIWTAKEAVYKACGRARISFSKDIKIISSDTVICRDKTYHWYHKWLKAYFLSIVHEKGKWRTIPYRSIQFG